jgi:hypothetical protein
MSRLPNAGLQRAGVYAAEAEVPSHDLHHIGDVQRFLDEAMAVISEHSIATELIQPNDPRIPAEHRAEAAAAEEAGRRLRAFGLAVPDERKILVVDAGQAVLTNGLNALHEATHVLVPTDEDHGPAFVRAWLDLLDRFGPYKLPRLLLIDGLKARQIRIDDSTSRLCASGPGHLRPI